MSVASAHAEIVVEVSFAEPDRAVVKAYRLGSSSNIDDALRVAGADPDFAGIDISGAAVGVFGRIAMPHEPLRDGDRVEIYRPLAADPKSARRARVKEARRKR